MTTLHTGNLADRHDAHVFQTAARVLLEARNRTTLLEGLPEALRPHDNESGWRIQTEVTDLLTARGDRIAGWKCATPHSGMLIVAPIYRSLLFKNSDGAALRLEASSDWVEVEPELAVVLACDMPPRDDPYTVREIVSGIGTVHPALEMIASRYADAKRRTFPELLADGLFNNGLLLADDIHVAGDVPPRLTLTIDVEGDVVTRDGVHPEGEVLGPLVWLVNFLRERGVGLRRGDTVITGSYAGVLRFPVDRQVKITFGSLGTMQFRFQHIPQ